MSDLNFESLFGDSTVDFTCPKCKTETPVKLKDAGKTIVCPKCNVEIELQKDENFDKSVNEVNNSLQDIENTLDNLGE